ncbi:DUF368 domain-containing protein [Propioniciclava soli]|uniref:DUF368 domain-containing protein n=1 Tax=Propioniciclava soli TaxID=2775081 RepID=UPI001E422701|nr:DUF368 domain-containing protein [Propioniciclava soli]
MSTTQPAQTPSARPDATDRHLDAPESVGAWLVRLLKGIAVGIGFILPGLSGGVLAVIFKIYDPMIRFLGNIRHRFLANVRYFIPVGIGAVIGIILFSILVAAAFGRYEAAFVCLFIGFVIGTFPSLWRQAGKNGRAPKHLVILGVSAVLIFALMLFGGQMDLNVPPSIPVWFGSGALIGLGVIVPGMSPSNFLIYFGLYDKMAEGIRDLDPTVFIPLFVGLVACVLLFAKAASWAFDTHYAGMYHFILGMVIGSSVAIFPTVVFTAEAVEKAGLGLPLFLVFCAAMLLAGIVASWLFSKVEDRYAGERDAIDAG